MTEEEKALQPNNMFAPRFGEVVKEFARYMKPKSRWGWNRVYYRAGQFYLYQNLNHWENPHSGRPVTMDWKSLVKYKFRRI